MNYKFSKGQTVYFLADPEFYDEDCDGEIIEGVVTRRYTEEESPCYDLKASDGEYERLEEYLYSTLDEAKEAVNAYFAEWRVNEEECVKQARQDLKSAKSALADLDQRINSWKVKSHQQPINKKLQRQEEENIIRGQYEMYKDHEWQIGDTAYCAKVDPDRGKLITVCFEIDAISEFFYVRNKQTGGWYHKADIAPNELAAVANLYLRVYRVPSSTVDALFLSYPKLKHKIKKWFFELQKEVSNGSPKIQDR